MNISDPLIDVFIDDAGNTGDNVDPIQTNMFLAGVVIPSPYAAEFWPRVDRAWAHAGVVCGQQDDGIELKGEELYGGKGLFKGVALVERQKIIDLIFEALSSFRVTCFWEGVPKHMWRDTISSFDLTHKDVPLWKSSLFAYCTLLYELLDMLYEGGGDFRVVGDENSWIEAGRVLIPPPIAPWPRLSHGGIIFDSSSRHRGLQIADILVHTLYRANKQAILPASSTHVVLSNTDKLAASYLETLIAKKLVFNLNQAVRDLRAKLVNSSQLAGA